jgi:AbiV family abortive infection protein
MKKKLDAYVGKLNARQVADGINAAAKNAKRLLEDALTLYEKERYPSARSLAILSIEESGKISILRGLILEKEQKDVFEAWKSYRSHTKKNAMWILLDPFKSGARKLSDFQMAVEPDSEHTFLLDQLKQVGFYSDCLGKAHWSIPDEVVQKETVDGILLVAKVLSEKEEVTTREMELWVDHLGPIWKKSKEQMEAGVVNWYAAMQAEGLKESGKNEMAEFIIDGIGQGKRES